MSEQWFREYVFLAFHIDKAIRKMILLAKSKVALAVGG